MIDKNEIDQKVKDFDINSSDVQRDYVFGWILAGMYDHSNLKDKLVLKGGNCFRKAYFENTRFSRDLDFSCKTEIPVEHMTTEFNNVSLKKVYPLESRRQVAVSGKFTEMHRGFIL